MGPKPKPKGGCVYCTYEVERHTGASRHGMPRVAPAVAVVATRKGARDLCAAHASGAGRVLS